MTATISIEIPRETALALVKLAGLALAHERLASLRGVGSIR